MVRQPKPLLLLSFLALEPKQERRFLAELFWPNAKDPQGSLRVCLRQLRRASPDLVEVTGGQLMTRLESDAAAFERAFLEGDDATAFALYRGPFLATAPLDSGNVELEEWVISRRERYAELERRMLLRRAEEALAAGLFTRASAYAEAAYRVRGAPELGVFDLQRLYAVLLACQSPLWSDVHSTATSIGLSLPTPSTLASRLRRASDMVARVQPKEPLAWPDSASSCDEVRRLVDYLCGPTHAVVSVCGPPRAGKTRLAREACREPSVLSAFDGPEAFLDLAEIDSSDELPAAVARAFGLDELGIRSASGLAAELGHTRALLVLDGIDGVRMEAVGLVTSLLQTCPNLKIVTTTTSPLGLQAEVKISLPAKREPSSAL